RAACWSDAVYLRCAALFPRSTIPCRCSAARIVVLATPNTLASARVLPPSAYIRAMASNSSPVNERGAGISACLSAASGTCRCRLASAAECVHVPGEDIRCPHDVACTPETADMARIHAPLWLGPLPIAWTGL